MDFIGLAIPAKDNEIWDYALQNGFTIITKDNDFLDLLELKGFPPKVVLLKTGNNSSSALADLLISVKELIAGLVNDDYGLLELVNK